MVTKLKQLFALSLFAFSFIAMGNEPAILKADVSVGFAKWAFEDKTVLLIGECDYSPPQFSDVVAKAFTSSDDCGAAGVFAYPSGSKVLIDGVESTFIDLRPLIGDKDSFLIEIDGIELNIQGFQAVLSQANKDSTFFYNSELSKIRIVLFVALTIALFLAYEVAKYALRKAKQLAKTAKYKVVQIGEAKEAKRVARIAEDEAIRQIVFSQAKNATSDELEVLKEQIKAALDANDTKTASNLMRVLSTQKNK
ncbi:hypothetical protein [Shewanella sp. Koi 1]